MKFKHLDYCTHFSNSKDIDILTRRSFNVNMRLFKSSEDYKNIILSICDYIKWCSSTEKEGYKKPHGYSGANAGIPFNIIAVNRVGRTDIMINPVILKSYGKSIISKSNCGSLTLEKPIEIFRHEFIDIEYFLENGNKITELKVDRYNGGFTIQHEIEHNLGILITNK